MIRDLEAAGYFFFDMSQIEQAYYIALFIGTHYFYGSGSYTAENMIDMHYGTCFAYSDLAFCMAKKTGIDAWLCVPGRPVEHNNRYYGSAHRTVVIKVDGDYYDMDANYAYVLCSQGMYRIFGIEKISESYAKYLLGETDAYSSIN